MAISETTALVVDRRHSDGSRAARRLRRQGKIPGVVYGGDSDPVSFEVDSRVLRQALAHAGAVLDLSIDGGSTTPVVMKELARHPVNGETMHVDLLRVRLDQAIQATVILELVGSEDAPGVKEGGVLEHVTRELTIEALPGNIPDTIEHDVSGMQIGDTVALDAITAPPGVTVIGDPETVVATVTPPRLQSEAEAEIEEETELVAEGAATGEAEEGAEESSDEGDSGNE